MQEHVNQVDDVCVSGDGLDLMLSTQQTTEYWLTTVVFHVIFLPTIEIQSV